MEAPHLQIREQQRETWDRFSPGWQKWDDFTMGFLRPMGDEIIAALRLRPTDTVLDIATGTGEPGLTLARLVPQGRVVGLDLSEGMLAVARQHAKAQGLTNYEAVAGDACELPFPDGTFDAVSCRMGFMFFPDMALAAREMARVLKPGGRLATSVWSTPDHNPWITGLMGVIGRNVEMPAPPPGAPGMFRCAKPGLIADLFREVGLTDVREREIQREIAYENPDAYWLIQNEVAAPVVAAMSKADDATRQRIKSEVFDFLKLQTNASGEVRLGCGSWIVDGVKR
jgi:ubiquinone/menaquinone biosynthesis C-methylase UbiE